METPNPWRFVGKKLIFEFMLINSVLNGLIFVTINRNLEKQFSLSELLINYLVTVVLLTWLCAVAGQSALGKSQEKGQLPARLPTNTLKVINKLPQQKKTLILWLIAVNGLLLIPITLGLVWLFQWSPVTYTQALVLQMGLCGMAGLIVGIALVARQLGDK